MKSEWILFSDDKQHGEHDIRTQTLVMLVPGGCLVKSLTIVNYRSNQNNIVTSESMQFIPRVYPVESDGVWDIVDHETYTNHIWKQRRENIKRD